MADPSSFASLGDLLADWSNDVLNGTPPVRWPAGAGPLARFPIGPGLVTLLGGQPGAGKTALGNQLAFDAVRLTPALKVLVTCCEMPPAVLLDRQLARLGCAVRPDPGPVSERLQPAGNRDRIGDPQRDP